MLHSRNISPGILTKNKPYVCFDLIKLRTSKVCVRFLLRYFTFCVKSLLFSYPFNKVIVK